VREWVFISQRLRQGGVECANKCVRVAFLLIEDEDSLAFCSLFGEAVGYSGLLAIDMLSEPLADQFDTLERMATVDTPGYAGFMSRFAAAAPTDVFQALLELVVEWGCGDVGKAALGKEVLGYGDGEGGVGFLKGRREA